MVEEKNTSRIVFITGNKGKYEEARRIIPSLVQKDLDLTEIQEIDPKAIIEHKLIQAGKHEKGMVVVEDISLSFDALGGLPGPLIKWFVKALGNQGIYDLIAQKNTNAQLSCHIGLLISSEISSEVFFFEASDDFEIVSPRGKNGFGFDPLIRPYTSSKTFGEMDRSEKEGYSMRAKAFRQLKLFLDSRGTVLG